MNDDHVTAGGPAEADQSAGSADPETKSEQPESANATEFVSMAGEDRPVPALENHTGPDTGPSLAPPLPDTVPELAPVAALTGEPAASEPSTETESGTEPEAYQGHPQRGFIAEWVVTIILLLFGTTNLVQAFVIPTGSMEDTLKIGDHLLVDKLAYAPAKGIEKSILPYSDIKRGDIIVFRYPMQIGQTFVKRCIGVPGDRIHLVNKQLWLNGKPMTEPYVVHKSEMIEPYRDNFPVGEPYFHIELGAHEMLAHHVENGDVVVPEGCYFAMGDNRDESSDSRFWGFVPRGNIIGKPLVIYWSYDAPTEALAGPFAIDHLLDMVLHFPTKTRWSRTFQFVHGYPLK